MVWNWRGGKSKTLLNGEGPRGGRPEWAGGVSEEGCGREKEEEEKRAWVMGRTDLVVISETGNDLNWPYHFTPLTFSHKLKKKITCSALSPPFIHLLFFPNPPHHFLKKSLFYLNLYSHKSYLLPLLVLLVTLCLQEPFFQKVARWTIGRPRRRRRGWANEEEEKDAEEEEEKGEISNVYESWTPTNNGHCCEWPLEY